MALDGFKHYKAQQARSTIETQTFQFRVEPLFCQGCESRIGRVFTQNSIFPISSQVTEFGNKDGDKTGTLEVTVTNDVSEDRIIEALTKAGMKLKDNPSTRLGY
ncbi:hypothetical protein [Candidatus Berkiella aquae]|uniref:HMA domain-containing protein n=1 Tax=Candidatus Berkiella aquae TaxID=295108 RepID=A0A0Q9YJ12_9GAMM|nr:hypothetical protein [Candidatus Berkiella aquae]MCS5710766.1 hypothetical protein [Candidatus Berkiella aquae]